MVKKSTISVIVPMYNTALYIKDCVLSLLNQTFSDIEIIIVDDGSTDDSYSICKNEFSSENRIKLLHQDNKGVSSARAYGVSEASGDYVFFVDSDDTVDKKVLEILYTKICDGYDVVVSECSLEGEFSGKDFVKFILEQRIRVSIWGKLFKRSLLTEQIMYLPSDINIGEDLALNIKIGLLVNKAYFISNNLYNYRYTPNSAMAKRKITLEYETKYHKLITEILADQMEYYLKSYLTLQFSSLEGLIVSKVFIDLNTAWIKNLFENARHIKLNRKQWVMLHIHNIAICRILLLIDGKICTIKRLFTERINNRFQKNIV